MGGRKKRKVFKRLQERIATWVPVPATLTGFKKPGSMNPRK